MKEYLKYTVKEKQVRKMECISLKFKKKKYYYCITIKMIIVPNFFMNLIKIYKIVFYIAIIF